MRHLLRGNIKSLHHIVLTFLPRKHWCRMWWDILNTPVLVCGSPVPLQWVKDNLFGAGLSRRDLKLPTCALGKCPEPGK